MCKNCEPFGGKWKETDACMVRCDCPEGLALRHADTARKNPQKLPPVLSPRDTEVFVEMLSTIPFFPSESGARLMIAEEFRSMCRSAAEALWLAERMSRLYSRWPGLRDMRMVYCAKSIPLDGLLAQGSSDVYPDGIPAESERTEPLALSAGAMKALPAGHVATEDAQLDRRIRMLAHAKSMDARPKKQGAVPTNPDFKPVTEADVHRAVEELHEKRAREEAGL